MRKWLQKKLPIEKVLNDLRINDEYFPAEPPSPCPDSLFQVFEIGLLTDKIFSNLTLSDLKCCRLVHTTWSHPVTSYMTRSDDLCHIKLVYDDGLKRFHRSTHDDDHNHRQYKKNLQRYQLKKLNKVLEKSKNFPCSDFTFFGKDQGNLADPEPSKFFLLHGHKIRKLELHQIKFDNYNQTANNDDDDDDPFRLPLLTRFEWSNSTRAAQKILHSTKNSQQLVIPTFDFPKDLMLLIDSGRLSTVQKLDIFYLTSTPLKLTLLMSARPTTRLSKLCIHDDNNNLTVATEDTKNEIISAINLFLNFCKNSLTHLTFSDGPLNSLSKIELPIFPNLIDLKLARCTNNTNTQTDIQALDLRPGTRLDIIFPHLKKLDLSHLWLTKRDTNYFNTHVVSSGEAGVLKGVTTLVISESTPRPWLTVMRGLCPNFKFLTINRTNVGGAAGRNSELDKILVRIFAMWTHLETIDLMDMHLGDLVNPLLCLDTAFTGMSEDVCRTLCRQYSKPDEWSDIRNLMRVNEKFRKQFEVLKIWPSIRDLTGLKSLRMHWTEFHPSGVFPWTWVSGPFAFCMMHHLTTELVFHIRDFDMDLLRFHHADILPFVKVRCQNH